MSDRLSRIEARLGGIDQALADVHRRLDALEALELRFELIQTPCAVGIGLLGAVIVARGGPRPASMALGVLALLGAALALRASEPQFSLHAAVLGFAIAAASGTFVWAADVWFTTGPWRPLTAATVATVVVAAACLGQHLAPVPPAYRCRSSRASRASFWLSCSSSGAVGSRCGGLPRSSAANRSMPACLRA